MIITIAVAVPIAIGASGCVWLAIPGFGYSAYEYEKTGSLYPQPQLPHAQHSHATPSPTPELE